jgi:hypothetical protein
MDSRDEPDIEIIGYDAAKKKWDVAQAVKPAFSGVCRAMSQRPPPPPPAPGHNSPRPAGATLVGGLPWQQPATADSVGIPSPPPLPSAGEPQFPAMAAAPVIQVREAAAAAPSLDARRHWLSNYLGDEDVAAVLAWQASLWQAFRQWVRESPALAVSLAAHLVVILALALFIVRAEKDEMIALDLAFGPMTEVEAEKPGEDLAVVTIEESKPEEVKTEEPVVEAPKPTPPPPAEAIEAPGAEATEAASQAAAITTLLDGRNEGSQAKLVKAFGGSDATQSAVARALGWLARHQDKKTGLWSLQGPYLDGGSQENQLTAMALLAFQGGGHTTTEGKYRDTVTRGWKGLLATQLPDGRFDLEPMPSHHALYSHAQATIAICELYGMTKDPRHLQPAQRALAFATRAQGQNGGWRYEPGKPGDMSVTGWYMMAFKSAEMAGIDFPTATLAAINRFLDTVAVDGGKRYGYRLEEVQGQVDEDDRKALNRQASPVTAAVSAEGLLARQYLGWPRKDPRLVAGVELLLSANRVDFKAEKDVYAWYYITQVVHHLGGEPWDRWNSVMREVLPAAQAKGGGEAGSWDPALDKWGPWGGRLFTTCFCTYMLEVYYRHLPIYGAAE